MPYKDPDKRRDYARKAAKLYRERHPERVKADNAKWRSRPDYLEKVKIYKKKYRENGSRSKIKRKSDLKRYGLTPESFEELLRKQGSKCKICLQMFGVDLRPNVDHDHTTSKVRSLLCHGCNTAIGLLSEDGFRLARATAYLKHYQIQPEVAPVSWHEFRFVDLPF